MTTPLFGWVPPSQRDQAGHQAHDEAMARLPDFKLIGDNPFRGDKSVLWDFTRKVNGGKHFRVFRQVTGSCVGNGGGQAVWYVSAVEAVRNGTVEAVKLPFYLLPYGRSRHYAGLNGRGEGSFGSAFARAIHEDGILPADTQGLPRWSDEDGITWGQNAELEWSDGEAIDRKWLEQSRNFLIRTVGKISSLDDARTALQNGYSLTLASDWGGRMQCPTRGSPAVLLNEHADTWPHQMSCHGWWNHPDLGEIFCILNSWGPDAHGTPPDDAPPGSFWIKAADMNYIIRQKEVFSFSQFSGFPAQPLEEYLFKLIGR